MQEKVFNDAFVEFHKKVEEKKHLKKTRIRNSTKIASYRKGDFIKTICFCQQICQYSSNALIRIFQ